MKVRFMGIVVPLQPLIVLGSLCCFVVPAHGQEAPGASLRAAFRPGHNLTFVGLAEQTRWHVRNTENITGLDRQVWTPGVMLRYSFHINLYGDTGIALGTSIASYLDERNLAPASPADAAGEGALFRPGLATQFPSLGLGLVHNFANELRAGISLEYAALYFGEMRVSKAPRPGRSAETEGTGGDGEITPGSAAGAASGAPFERLRVAIIPDSWLLSAQLEAFVLPTVAVTIVGGYRTVQSNCLGGCSGSAFVNSLRLQTEGFYAGAGVSWQAGLFFDE